MVVIRLARHGSKHSPFYHVTVADRRARRDGAFIEHIGFYNPISRGQAERVRIDFERLEYWQGVGAQTTDTVKRLVREARRATRLAAETAPEASELNAEAASAEEATATTEAPPVEAEETAEEAASVPETEQEAVEESKSDESETTVEAAATDESKPKGD